MCAQRHRPAKAEHGANKKQIKVNKNPTKTIKSSKTSQKTSNKVRIIGGQFKRQWVPFIDAQGLRPSPDRLRETLFNWIQFELYGATVLDICAGSGVLGFESLSRGAEFVTFIELQPSQAKLISETLKNLKLPIDRAEIHIGDALHILPNLKLASDRHYTLVFIDPPYDLNLWVPLINTLIEQNLITNDTLYYIEDRRELSQSLQGLNHSYTCLKSTKVGQIFASLIQVAI